MSVVVSPESITTAMHVRIVGGTGGGPEKMILDSPRHFANTRFREIAAYLHSPGDPGIEILKSVAARKGCPFIPVPDHGPVDVRTLDRLTKLCRDHGVRIWQSHDYKSNLFGWLLKRRLGLKLVSTVHGWGVKSRKLELYYAIDKWCLRRFDQVVCVSTDLYEECLRTGVPESRLTLLENGIDTEEFKRRRAPWQACGDREPGRLVVGAVGRLSPEKGFDLLIDAVDRLIEEGLDLELWIAGEGPERPKLEARIAKMRKPHRVRLLGFRDDPARVFEQLDVYALSSLREGLPMVLLEAMAMEVPALATRCGGVDNVVAHERDGLLCNPGSVDELADGLRRLAKDTSLRLTLASGARRKVMESYRFAARVDRMREIYERVA